MRRYPSVRPAIRFVFTSLLAVFIVLQLTGCQSRPQSKECDDPLGCITLKPEEPIHIAVLQALSGKTRMFGVDQIRGIELALAEKGDSVLGHPIRLELHDSMCSSEGGKISAQKAVSNHRTVAVLGTTCSIAAVPAARIVSRAGLTMVSSSNTAPSLTAVQGEPGSNNMPGYFRAAHNDIHQGEAAAVFARRELGLNRAATIHDGDPYTKELAWIFQDVFEKEGGSIVFAGGVNKGDSDMEPILRAVRDSKAEVLFFPLFQPEGDFLVEQAAKMPSLDDLILMAAEGLMVESFLDSVGEIGRGMYFIGPVKPKGAAYRDLVRRYRKEYGQAPQSPYHAHAYDAAKMLLQVIEKTAARREDGSLLIGRQRLRHKFESQSGFQGLTGVLTCNEFGDCGVSKFNAVRLVEPFNNLESLRDKIVFTFHSRK